MKPNNPNPPNHETLEERVTALLLGELGPEEAEPLRQRIAQDPALREFQRRMERTLALVRQAATAATATASVESAEVRLSPARRQALRDAWNQKSPPRPNPRRSPRRSFREWLRDGEWLVPLAATACVLLFFLGLALPNFIKARGGGSRIAGKYADSTPAATTGADMEQQPPEPVTGTTTYRYKVDAANPPQASWNGSTTMGDTVAAGTVISSEAVGYTDLNRNSDRRSLGRVADEPSTMETPPPTSIAPSGSTSTRSVNIAAAPNQPALPSSSGTTEQQLNFRSYFANGPQPGQQPSSTIEDGRTIGLLFNEPADLSIEAGEIAPNTGLPAITQSGGGLGGQGGGGGFSSVDRKDREVNSLFADTEPVELFAKTQAGVAWAMPVNQNERLREGTDHFAAPSQAQPLPSSTPQPTPVAADDAMAAVELDKMERLEARMAKPDTAKRLPELRGGTPPTEQDGAATVGFGLERARQPEMSAEKKAAESLVLEEELAEGRVSSATGGKQLAQTAARPDAELSDLAIAASAPAAPPPQPLPETLTVINPFSTFSLNVSDVSFKLAAASLANQQLPDPGSIRSEEFVNALDFHDPAPAQGARLGFAWEQARNPFEHNRDLVRFSIQTAASGRIPNRPLNLVLLLDNSGSMERADRVQIIREAIQVLAGQLTAQDQVSVVSFARTPRLWVDGLNGGDPQELVEQVGQLNPEGGTNLELALDLAYQTARNHFRPNGNNRVILLTDGAANLGNVDPASLRRKVEDQRRQRIALDCFGIGWEGYNDDLMEVLSRHGDGRYGFLNHPSEAASEFADQLAGALRVAAADVKAQVEFNPQRVVSYRQIGFEKHQLTQEQFRDNTVDAAEIGAAESGTALYSIQVNPNGVGPLGIMRARYQVPGTAVYEEQEWTLPYNPLVQPLDQAYPSMRLAAVAASFAEWLARSAYAGNVTLPALQAHLQGVADQFPNDPGPRTLALMIQQARQITGQ